MRKGRTSVTTLLHLLLVLLHLSLTSLLSWIVFIIRTSKLLRLQEKHLKLLFDSVFKNNVVTKITFSYVNHPWFYIFRETQHRYRHFHSDLMFIFLCPRTPTIRKAERCQCLFWLVLEVGCFPKTENVEEGSMLKIYGRRWFFNPTKSFGVDLYIDIYQYIDICSWFRSIYIYMAIFRILCHFIIKVRNYLLLITYKKIFFFNEMPFSSIIFGNFLMQWLGGI